MQHAPGSMHNHPKCIHVIILHRSLVRPPDDATMSRQSVWPSEACGIREPFQPPTSFTGKSLNRHESYLCGNDHTANYAQPSYLNPVPRVLMTHITCIPLYLKCLKSCEMCEISREILSATAPSRPVISPDVISCDEKYHRVDLTLKVI